MSILIKPIITEKATKDTELNNRYTFAVQLKANKIQIKEAVEATYGVSVEKVRTLVQPAKRSTKYTKKGMVQSRVSGYKKAIIEVAEGEAIDIYSNL